MLKREVIIGDCYTAKVSNTVVAVQIISPYSGPRGGGWWAENLTTGRIVRIKSAAKLRQHLGARVDKFLNVERAT